MYILHTTLLTFVPGHSSSLVIYLSLPSCQSHKAIFLSCLGYRHLTLQYTGFRYRSPVVYLLFWDHNQRFTFLQTDLSKTDADL